MSYCTYYIIAMAQEGEIHNWGEYLADEFSLCYAWPADTDTLTCMVSKPIFNKYDYHQPAWLITMLCIYDKKWLISDFITGIHCMNKQADTVSGSQQYRVPKYHISCR